MQDINSRLNIDVRQNKIFGRQTEKAFWVQLLVIVWMLGSSQANGQGIDRFIWANAYQSNSLHGEWVLGETIITQFGGPNRSLHSGFLTGALKFTSTSTEHQSPHSLTIFPNPFSDQINIHHTFSSPVKVNIKDLSGRVLMEQRLLSQQAKVLVSELPPGPYFLSYYTDTHEVGIYLILKM